MNDLLNPGQLSNLSVDSLSYADSAPLGSTALKDLRVAVEGGDPADPLPWTVRSAHSSSWLRLPATTGAAPDTLLAQLDPAGLALGTYHDTLELYIAGAAVPSVRLPVAFQIVGCSVDPATINASASGVLTAADCGAPGRAGSYAAVFGFSAAANDSISIRMTAGFDGYLLLVNSSGAVVAQNDNCPGAGTNPCIVYFRLVDGGDYTVQVTSTTAGATGAFTLDITRPRAPAAPATVQQLQADLVTPVATGGTVDVTSINLRATAGDPDADQVRIDIEVRPLGTAFTNAATHTSAAVASGAAATVAVTGLTDDVSYHWQLRSTDATGRASAWQSFGGNAETAADFRVAVPQDPALPASAAQRRTDGTTAIAVGGTTDESSVQFQAMVSDPDAGDQLRLEIEVKPVGAAFTNTASGTSPLTASGATATATVAGLSDNVTYRWQYRSVDQAGRASAWASFGANAESASDFRVALAPSRLTVLVQPSGAAAGATITPAVQVAAQDAGGTTLASFTGNVTVAIGNNAGGGTLGGTLTQAAVAGTATFPGLAIDRAGTGYTLVFTTGAINTISAAFTITASSATRLVFTVQPPNGQAGAALTPAIQVTAQDAQGNTATGFTGPVTIGIGANPGGATLGGTNPVNAVAGVATFATLTLNRSGSGYTLTAASSGLVGATSNAFDVVAGSAARLAVVQQASASATSGAAFGQQPAVQVQDANGSAVAQQNVVVTATVASGPPGATLLNATATTDANGLATFSGLAINGTVGSYVLAFGAPSLTSANGNAILLGAGSATRLAITTQPSAGASSGAVFTQQPVIQLQDGAGNNVPQAGVSVQAAIATGGGTLGGTATVVTSSGGVAAFTDLSITGAAGARTLAFTATSLAGATSNAIAIGSGSATTIALSAGNGQSAVAGSAVATPPAVLVTDASGNPVAGVSVTFAVTGGGGSVGAPATVATNGQGIAAAASWTLGTTAGANTLTATSSGLSGSPVQFTATGTVGTATSLTISSGNNLTGQVNTQLGADHVVLVTDANGNPVSGIVVGWAALGGGSVSVTQSSTDGTGRAATRRTLGPTAGALNQTTTATATLGGSPVTVTFNMNASVGGASTLAISGGDNQSGTVGQNLATPLSVLVTDGTNPVGGVTINWQVTAGGGQVGGATSTSSQTNASGIATITWTMGQTAGAQGVRAEGPGTPVNFIATANPGAVNATNSTVSAAPLSITASNAGSGLVNSTITVTARDAFNNVIQGQTVTLAGTGSGNTIGQPGAQTNASGVATGTFASSVSGTHDVSATINGVAVTTPATVAVLAAAPAAVAFVTQPSDAAAGATITPAVQVEIRDQFLNRVLTATNSITLAFQANPGGATLGGTTTMAATNGLATFGSLTVNRPGTGYTLAATSGVLTGAISNGFTVTVGVPSAAQSSASVPAGTAGSATTVTVIVRDASGNIRTAGGDQGLLAVSVTGANSATPTVVDAGGGSYTATYTPAATGSDNITVTLGGAGVTGSPLTSVVSAGAAAAAQTTALVPGGVAGSATTITITVRDASGNVRTAGTDAGLLAVSISGANTAAPAVTSAGGGSYTASYTPTASGTDNVAITLSGAAISGTPTTSVVGAGAAVAAQTTAVVPAGTAGSPTTATITVRDANGNVRTATNDAAQLAVSVTGANTATPAVVSLGAGIYTATWTPTASGTDNVAITLGGTAIGGSPYASAVGAGAASAAQTTAVVPAGTSGVATTVTITVRDASGNVRTAGGDAGLLSVQVSGANTATPAVVDAGGGLYTAAYTPQNAGTDNITITLSGSGISGSAFTSLVGPGTPSAAQTTASVPAGTSGSTTTVTIIVRDAAGNVRSAGGDAAQLAVSVTGANTAAPAVVDAGGGSYTATYTPTVSGTDNIAITLGGTAIAGSPLTSAVAVGTASAAQTTAVVPAGTSGAATTITITVRDAAGNVRTAGGDAGLLAVSVTGVNTATPSVVDAGNGTYTASYTPVTAGTDNVTITLNGTGINGSVFTSLVGPAAPSAAQTTGSVPAGTAGSPTTVTITVRDASGNVRTAGGDAAQLAVSVTGANTATPAIVDAGNGLYTATYTPTANGTDDIAVTLGGTAIGNSPLASVVSVGGASAATTTASVPAGTAGSPTTVTITVRDGSGNIRTAGGDAALLAVNVTGANTATPAIVDAGNGTYTAIYTPTVTGTDDIAITLSGAAISGSPFTSAVGTGAPSAATTTAAVPAGTAGSATTVTITVRDGSGNIRTAGGDAALLAVSVTGANTTTPAVVDAGNGLYTATYTPTAAGTDNIAITLSGAPISGSPYSSAVGVGAAAAATTTATVPAGTAGTATTVTITVRDASGNIRTAGGDAALLAVNVTGANSATPAIVDAGNGLYTATYTPAASGTDNVAITLSGAAISGSPYTSLVSSGAASAAQTTASVPAGTAGSPTTVTITVRDAGGNVRTEGGDAGLLAVSVSGANTATPSIVDAGNGLYTATYTPTAPGTDDVAITLGGAAIGGSPYTSAVGVGAAVAATTTASVPAGTPGSPTTVTITVRDGSGNIRTAGGDAALLAVNVTGANTATPTVVDAGSGLYTATYTPAAAGNDNVAITLGGAAISGSPYTSVVSTLAQTITFDAPPASATFGTTFTITQPTATSGLAVTVTPTGGCTITGLDVTMTSGTTACTLTASQAGNATYAPATDVTHIVNATRATQAAVTLTPPADDSVDATGLVAVAAGGSGTGAFSYLSTTTAVCTIDAGTGAITALTPGACTLTATRAADADYLAQTSAPASFTVTPGAPNAIERNSVALQNGTVGQPVGAAPSVTVRDRNNNPIDGASVTFTPANGSSVNGGGSNTPAIVATAGGGIATLASWTLSTGAGTQNLTATVTLTAISIGFAAEAAAGAPANLIIFAGDNQSATAGTATAPAPTVIVEDAFNNRVPGASVSFTATVGGGSVSGSPATTNSSGVAAPTSWTLGTTAGPNELEASVNGLTVTFHATGTAGIATRLSITTQPSAVAEAGRDFERQPVVQLVDANGNAVSQFGVNIQASIESGFGDLNGNQVINTNLNGTAEYSNLEISGIIGTRTLRFSADLLVDAISDPILVVAGFPNHVTPAVQPPASVASGTQFSVTFELRDQWENPTDSVRTITLSLTGGAPGAQLSGVLSQQTTSGVVTFSGLSVDLAGTGYRLVATAAGGGVVDGLSDPFEVTPGAASTATSEVTTSPGTVSLGSATPVTITLRVRDSAGNLIGSGGLANVTFALSNGAGESQGTLDAVQDVGDGTYTIVFTPTGSGTPVTVTASIGGNAVAQTATIEVQP